MTDDTVEKAEIRLNDDIADSLLINDLEIVETEIELRENDANNEHHPEDSGNLRLNLLTPVGQQSLSIVESSEVVDKTLQVATDQMESIGSLADQNDEEVDAILSRIHVETIDEISGGSKVNIHKYY